MYSFVVRGIVQALLRLEAVTAHTGEVGETIGGSTVRSNFFSYDRDKPRAVTKPT
jgi:hypothetical protein